MKISRTDLLQRLLCVEPGLATRGADQCNCVALRRGRFYTFSQEIACSLVSGLDKEIDGAIRAEKLIKLLEKTPDEEVDITIESKTLSIKSAGKRATDFAMEEEILLPFDEVELPKSEDWIRLHEDFSESVDLVHRCTKKKNKEESSFIAQCVHIHPEWMEASDNSRMIRYNIKTFVKDSILVRGETIKVIAQLGMTKGCETENWLHFRNPMGLRVSLRKFAMEAYPDLEEFLNLRGEKIIFPKGLQDAADRAGDFVEDDGGIQIKVAKQRLSVTSQCLEAKHTESMKLLNYTGSDISFIVPPKLIAELVKKHTACEVTPASLRVNGGKYIYATSLEIQP